MAGPRERLLETSTRLFAVQGYNATGINQIIAEAEVAKASFYQHFKSKEDLCLEFLNVRHQYWFGELIRYIGLEENPKVKVLRALDFLIYMNEKEKFRGCSFLNILSEIPAGNTKILAVIKRHKSDLRTYFLDVVGDRSTADHIYLLFESCLIESKLFASNEFIEHSKQLIEGLID